jgi:MYXO-CTERM domain-containing protein
MAYHKIIMSLVSFLLAIMPSAGVAIASTISYEPFNLSAGAYVLGGIGGQQPPVIGYAGPWSFANTQGSASGAIDAGLLAYSDGSGNDLPVAGGMVTISTLKTSVGHDGIGIATRGLDVPAFGPTFTSTGTQIDKGVLYLSFLSYAGSPVSLGNNSATVSLLNGGAAVLQIANQVDANCTINGVPIASPSNSSQAQLFVLKLEMGPGNDTATVWVDPQLGLSTEPTFVAGVNGGTLSGLNIVFNTLSLVGDRYVPLDLITKTGFSYFDEIRFGTDWASVTPVPEPSGMLLAALGALLAWQRQRPCRCGLVGVTPAARQ